MSEQASERMADGRDHRGRLTETKLMSLAMLAKKTMEQMAAKGKDATDNYFFFNDIHSACWQAFEQLEDLESMRNMYIRERELVALLIAKTNALEMELSGYRTIQSLERAGTLAETIERIKIKMKKTETQQSA